MAIRYVIQSPHLTEAVRIERTGFTAHIKSSNRTAATDCHASERPALSTRQPYNGGCSLFFLIGFLPFHTLWIVRFYAVFVDAFEGYSLFLFEYLTFDFHNEDPSYSRNSILPLMILTSGPCHISIEGARSFRLALILRLYGAPTLLAGTITPVASRRTTREYAK